MAQACALVPGVSRSGATLAAARRRGFAREDARRLSRHVAVPVIAGAAALKGVRAGRRGFAGSGAAQITAGVAASFFSTLATARVIRRLERDRSLAPYAVYRTALGATVLRRLTAPGTTMTS